MIMMDNKKVKKVSRKKKKIADKILKKQVKFGNYITYKKKKKNK